MKNFTGFLIRQQRLQRGLSQEALCLTAFAVGTAGGTVIIAFTHDIPTFQVFELL